LPTALALDFADSVQDELGDFGGAFGAEFGVDGEGEDPAAEVLGHRERTLCVTRVQVGFLVVKGDGVINHGRNTPSGQGIAQFRAVQIRMQAQSVLMENVGAVRRRLGDAEPG